MNKLNEYYSELKLNTSPEVMAERIIAEDKAKTKRISFRKPAIIAAAAAVIMVGGVTAGAATGLFSFNQIFGSMFSAESEALGNKLLASAENVQYTISDENYKITLNGVTGSPANIIVNFEISRMDGVPIERLIGIDSLEFTNFDSDGSGFSYNLNELGNIEVEGEFRLNQDSIINDNYLSAGPMKLVGTADFEDEGSFKSLNWSVAFDYTPTAESMKLLKADDLSKHCTLNVSRDGIVGEEVKSLEFELTALKLTSSVGIIKCKTANTGVEYLPTLNDSNTFTLIKKDGSKLNARITSLNGSSLGEYSYSAILHYYQDIYYEQLVINLDEIEAISINGTVYELS